MKKPWEEEWEYDDSQDEGLMIFVREKRDDWELVAEHGWQSSDVPKAKVEARMRLAAEAPEMVRLLRAAYVVLHSSCPDQIRKQIRDTLRRAGVDR